MSLRLLRIFLFLVVIAIGAYLWTVATAFGVGARLGRAGPDVWPKIILGLIILAAAYGAVQALFRKNENEGLSLLVEIATRSVGREEETQKELDAESGPVETRRPIYAVGGIVAMLGFVAGIPYLGFSVTTFLLMFAVMMIAGYRRPSIAALVSFLGALAFFFVFQRIVYVSLPLGVGPFKELSTGLMVLFGVR